MVSKPAVPETREVFCTHCNRSIEISSSAMSVSCRHCNKRVEIEDMKIKAYHAVRRLATAGSIEVTKNASLVAKVRAKDLVVKGSIKGDVVAIGRVAVEKKAAIEGDVCCRSISIAPGAKLDGHFDVRPDYEPIPEEGG
ncbi:MAG: bactofilin family protein [Planctomycetota bacterium]|jgi:DNA-directed RNA polymerase subunit RPC12/RpoP